MQDEKKKSDKYLFTVKDTEVNLPLEIQINIK